MRISPESDISACLATFISLPAMSDLPIPPAVYLLLNLHCLLGGIAAIVAARKGRPLGRWLIFGLFGGTAALAVALLMPAHQSKQSH